MMKKSLAFQFLLKTLIVMSMFSWLVLGSTTVILNKGIDGGDPAESNFNGYFSFEKKGFKYFDTFASTYKQSGANQTEVIVRRWDTWGYIFTETFLPVIENSGLNKLEINLVNCSNIFFHPSTRGVSDEYYFITSPQVLECREEKGGQSHWRGSVQVEQHFPEGGGINLDPDNNDVYGPYEIDFKVELGSWVSDTITVVGFGVGTALSLSAKLTIFEPLSSAVLGIGAGACFAIAGIAANHYTTIEETVETNQINVGYGYMPELIYGIKADYHYRVVQAYPDENQNGIAEGAIKNEVLHYWKNYRHEIEFYEKPAGNGYN